MSIVYTKKYKKELVDIEYIDSKLELLMVFSIRCHEYAVFLDKHKKLIILDLASIQYNNNNVQYRVVSDDEITTRVIVAPGISVVSGV